MTPNHHRNFVAKWLIVALLTIIAACLLIEVGATVSDARAQTVGSGGQAGDVFAIAGQVTSNSYGLYLVDLKNRSIAIYQWVPNTRKLRFVAARNFTYDLQLENYNTEESPRDIRNLVHQQRRLDDAESETRR